MNGGHEVALCDLHAHRLHEERCPDAAGATSADKSSRSAASAVTEDLAMYARLFAAKIGGTPIAPDTIFASIRWFITILSAVNG